MTEPSGNESPSNSSLKRPRPVISCLECRRKKLKCDRTLPCQQCSKVGRGSVCSYQSGQEPEPQEAHSPEKRLRPNSRERTLDTPQSPAAPLELNSHLERPARHNGGVLEQLQERVATLERLVGTEPERVPPIVSNRNHENGVPLVPTRRSSDRRAVSSLAFPHAAAFMRELACESGHDPALLKVGRELQGLHTVIKAHQKPKIKTPLPCSNTEVVYLLPDRKSCETLVELYFDNMEHCFRILHRPTFDRQLREFWVNPIEDSGEFLSQLLGVISIASILGVRQECIDVKVKSSGQFVTMSVDYMHRYLNTVHPKHRYRVPTLQVKMMLLLLRWMRLDRIGDLWDLSGQILRQALIMGLDRDPDDSNEPVNVLQTELKRRIWATVVEEDMMLSILCNMPCMVPDFTCRGPVNVNDDELSDNLTCLPQSRPIEEWTDSLCQFVLAKSLRQRLHACKDLESAHDTRYEHFLDHTRSFEKILQQLPPPLRFNHQGDEKSKAPARFMARMELDISIRRPLMRLYSPFAYADDRSDTFQEARSGFLQSCLMLTTYQDLFDPKYSEIDVPRPEGYWDFFYNVYRQELNQGALGLCLAIQRAIKSPPDVTTPRPYFGSATMPRYNKGKLVHAMKDILEPMTRRISHPGSNLKDLAHWVIVFSSVSSNTGDYTAIVQALQDLIVACKSQLERDGIQLPEPPISQENTAVEGIADWNEFDPSWMDFPNLGLDFGDIVDSSSPMVFQ